MSFNQASLQGSLPKSEKFPYAIYNQETPEKAVFRGVISVRKNFKKEGQQYADDVCMPIKIFGKRAVTFYSHFKPGSAVMLTGEIDKDDAYTDNSGNKQPGSLFLNVSNFFFIEGSTEKVSGESAPAASREPAPQQAAPAPRAGALPPLPGRVPKLSFPGTKAAS